MTNTPDNPLALYTWDELVAELVARSRSIVIAYEHDKKLISSDVETSVDFHFHGGCLAGIGLCRWAESRILSLLSSEDEPEDDPD